ncbi:hypothetical protein N9C35_04095 [Flavobacteriaceae bacterium]|nr:hypothetical protein [Flavobacteriaceae bacterium]
MSEGGAPAGVNSAMLASMQSHGGNVDHGNLGSGGNIQSSGIFGNITEDGLKMIGEGSETIDSMFSTGSFFQEMLSKFNAIEDNIFSFAEMLDNKGPFPIMRKRAQNFIKFVGSTSIANLSFGPQLNMKGGISAVSIKGRESQG